MTGFFEFLWVTVFVSVGLGLLCRVLMWALPGLRPDQPQPQPQPQPEPVTPGPKQGDLRVVKVTDVAEIHRPPADGTLITFEVQRWGVDEWSGAGGWSTVATYEDERDAHTHVANVLCGYPIREVLS